MASSTFPHIIPVTFYFPPLAPYQLLTLFHFNFPMPRLCQGGLCSLPPSTLYPILLAPFPFRHSLLLTNFQCSFFISLCSMFLFNFSSCSLIIFLAPCSWLLFFCSLLCFPNLCAPCSKITFSLLPALFLILGHAPCSLGSQGSFSMLPASFWTFSCIVPLAF